MTGVDTNVLVRYLTRDDPGQYARAKVFLESCTPEHPGYVHPVVLCELVWVLKRAYGATKEERIRVLEQMLRTVQLRVGDHDAVRAALEDHRTTDAGFADCLIARMNRRAGCTETVTFDRTAGAVLDGVRVL